MARYDEDLHENEFFRTLVSKHTTIFNEAAEKKLLICVPRRDTISRLKLSQNDFENHILRPQEADHKYTSLNEKCAEIHEDVIVTGPGYKEIRKVKILFEECFFNPNDESYQVLCLDQPLEGVMCDDVAVVSLETLDDCCRFLWSAPGSDKARKSIDHSLNLFTSNFTSNELLLIVDRMSDIYTQAVQEVWKLPSVRKVQSTSYRSSYKLAIETYIMANLHQEVFKELCFYLSTLDEAFNKITRNYSDISPECLGIKPQYRINIEKAKVALSELNQFCTPLEKLCCFRRTIGVLTTLLGTSSDVMTADDLLPILVYLVITSNIPNWNANIFYTSKFHFSDVNQDEFVYCLASFEAAVEYVRTDVTKNMNSSSLVSSLTRQSSAGDSGENAVSLYFKLGKLDEIKELLDQEGVESAADAFCHPLCSCEKCTSLVEKRLNDTNRVTVNTRDADGQTGLHHAAKYGLKNIVHYLMEMGASVTATDHHSSTPVHLACQKGHQSCLLLLLADSTEPILNAKDESGNTPLHLACSNGHEECAKALLFQRSPCQIDAANVYGDTPLHNAARWGYASIVAVLLEHGASVNIINKSGEAPLNCAQSRKVQELLARRDIPRGASVSAKSADAQKAQRRRSKVSDSGGVGAEAEKQLKKLLRAIRDNDLKLVEFMFTKSNLEDDALSGKPLADISHHPLCPCSNCFQNALINAYDTDGFAPLHHAAKQGNVKMVEYLLRHGADVIAATKGDGLISLHLACQYNHRDVVVILLDNGSEVNACDCHGNTPLHFSCSNGHVDTAAILLYHGADVTKVNDRDDTALHLAARWNQSTLVKELLLFGAQYSAINKDHKTPLELTKDDQVRAVIEKAMRGEIEVGSYCRTDIHNIRRAPESTNSTPKIVALTTESENQDAKVVGNEVHSADPDRPM